MRRTWFRSLSAQARRELRCVASHTPTSWFLLEEGVEFQGDYVAPGSGRAMHIAVLLHARAGLSGRAGDAAGSPPGPARAELDVGRHLSPHSAERKAVQVAFMSVQVADSERVGRCRKGR